ncbi:hypothetical protein V5799_006355 [Amblyomma americanum]|uniref:Uncharacterized protein n=1 Tax=Amblyomma americanum TaxID=6943 RepID=A0AAQ4DWM4_AMBAM
MPCLQRRKTVSLPCTGESRPAPTDGNEDSRSLATAVKACKALLRFLKTSGLHDRLILLNAVTLHSDLNFLQLSFLLHLFLSSLLSPRAGVANRLFTG